MNVPATAVAWTAMCSFKQTVTFGVGACTCELAARTQHSAEAMIRLDQPKCPVLIWEFPKIGDPNIVP